MQLELDRYERELVELALRVMYKQSVQHFGVVGRDPSPAVLRAQDTLMLLVDRLSQTEDA